MLILVITADNSLPGLVFVLVSDLFSQVVLSPTARKKKS